MLWEALIELEDRRGHGVFNATYRWRYVQPRSVTFDSSFIRLLNDTPWIPDEDGEPQLPSSVLFESLGWRHNSYLATKIQFKKPIVEELAKEAGIDLEVIQLLQKLGLTSIDELKSRLQVEDDEDDTHERRPSPRGSGTPGGASSQENDDDEEEGDAEAEGGRGRSGGRQGGQAGQSGPSGGGGHANAGNGAGGDRVSHPGGHGSSGPGTSPSRGTSTGTPTQPAGDGREFVSYIAVRTEEDSERDPDGLAHADRLALEALAIELILNREPGLEAMPAGNKGFDLVERGSDGQPKRWVEVKAMIVTLQERAVGLSSEQFEQASVLGDKYWLYVVENARDPARSRIVKIQDPAGRASTFTFDRGWVEIAEIDDLLEAADPED